MRIKLTLDRPGTTPVDLQITVDVKATIGDLAEYLVRSEPVPRGAGARPVPAAATLHVLDGPDPGRLDPRTTVGDSGLRSGATVRVEGHGGLRQGSRARTTALVTVVSGPDAGTRIELRGREGLIGRDAACAVRLSDQLVSRQHARVTVGRFAEIADLGSANGIQIAGATVARATLQPGDIVQLGDTEITVTVTQAVQEVPGGTEVGFIRSPQLSPHFDGEEFAAPEPPQRPARARFPILPLVTPPVVGGMMYLVTGSVASVAFVALSPLMAIGQAVESIRSGRSEYKRGLRAFRAETADLVARMAAAVKTETVVRGREHPPLEDCLTAAERRSTLLWSRHPGRPGFGEIRLGVGRLPSRGTVGLPAARGLPADLMAELFAAVAAFRFVDGLPVVVRLGEDGALGLAGERQAVLGAARAVLAQAVVLHSPAELVVAAFVSGESSRVWDWLKWLPHTTSPHSPLPRRHLVSGTVDTAALVSALEDLIRRRTEKDEPVLPAVLIVVESDTVAEHAQLVDIAERGRDVGVYVVWLAEDTLRLPAACRTVVRVHPAAPGSGGPSRGTAVFITAGEKIDPVAVQLLDERGASATARALASLTDIGARLDDDSDLPPSLSLLAVPEQPTSVTPEGVVESWLANRSIVTGPYAPAQPVKKAGSLRAVIGVSASGPHALDLRADGPHALVGGTTGSGKSELLQSWILAMATAHSPERLTFLLMDYKGGSALSHFERLPHTVGLVTDLDDHQAGRALTSLGAELRWREQVLAGHRAKDLVEMEKRGSRDAPPSLVIVIDEFAALIKELPGFVDGMIDVAQRGRSLGVHLILATQRPAGVIHDNLRANTNLRLALRTADVEDSVNVLGSPDAAFFDAARPGRAVSKTGPGRLVRFQTGYAGGWTSQEPEPPDIVVEELRVGPVRRWEAERPEQYRDDQATDLNRLVAAISAAGAKAALPTPRKPWLPALEPVCNLLDLVADPDPDPRRGEALVFGIADRPSRQDRVTVAFEPDRHGNLAVVGTGGSGKSALLRTLAIVAGLAGQNHPCQVYGLDFGARGLSMLEPLPYVDIISGDDRERLTRLLRMLLETIADRARRYPAIDAGTITAYRERARRPREPRILLLLDGMAGFQAEHANNAFAVEALNRIATEGRPFGVHLVLTADRPQTIPSSLAAAMQAKVVLRLADQEAYGHIGLPMNILTAASPPGRGLHDGMEIQVAVLGHGPEPAAQAAEVGKIATAMTSLDVPRIPPIRRLPEMVPLEDLPAEVHGRPVLGVASDTLEPLTFDPAGALLVCGPPQSGRTGTVGTLAAAFHRWRPDARLYHFGDIRSPWAQAPIWSDEALDVESAADVAKNLLEQLAKQNFTHPVGVFVENVADFAGGPADMALAALARHCAAQRHFLVMEGESSTLGGAAAALTAAAKSRQTGLALAPDASASDYVHFRTTFPRGLSRSDFPPGRGLYVAAGKTTVVQVGRTQW
ncbi:S-DNA-T family DNA segregation ATPase FtsK/SpoIIIE [Catenulispora sp. EB89]|uniref:FtsK/SpoIIIE domain-containing protein n=1 Tax=Catenulispora sp. EB89 TaxID=3156257 RepID=UPI0035149F1E